MAAEDAMNWLIHLDERIFLAVNHAGGPGTDAFFSIATYAGHGAVLALLLLVPMALFDRARLREHILAMVLSVSVGALAVEAIKWAVDRDRPARHFAASTEPPGEPVRMPGEQLYDKSFPSGHTQAAFGAATYTALLYPVLAVPALALAVLVGLSRIFLGAHFPLDVLAGALIGIAFSIAGFLLRKRWDYRKPTPLHDLTPQPPLHIMAVF